MNVKNYGDHYVNKHIKTSKIMEREQQAIKIYFIKSKSTL